MITELELIVLCGIYGFVGCVVGFAIGYVRGWYISDYKKEQKPPKDVTYGGGFDDKKIINE